LVSTNAPLDSWPVRAALTAAGYGARTTGQGLNVVTHFINMPRLQLFRLLLYR
jgi:hypothetical protein